MTLLLIAIALMNQQAAIDRGRAAFAQNDFAAATRAYQEVLATDSVPAHRVEAATALANYAWRLHRDTATALKLLAEIELAFPDRSYPVIMERARLLREEKMYARAAREASRALLAAKTGPQRVGAQWAHAAAIVARGRADVALDSSIAVLRRIVRDDPGRLAPAHLLVTAAALRRDFAAVREGWRSYYLVLTGDSLAGPLAQPRRVVAQTAATTEQLASALADSRFYRAAAHLTPARTTSARLQEVRAYAEFIDAVQHATDEYYRQLARRIDTHDRWRATLDSLARVLWPRLRWERAAPNYGFQEGFAELERRFGAMITLGETAGYRDMHYGHTVVDAQRNVRQYGQQADVRFIALDMMVSNGFQSWAWDGSGQHGGWGGTRRIVQIRPAYADAPLAVWEAMNDTTRAVERSERLRATIQADLVKGRIDSLGYFPSVAQRLPRQGRERLLDSLRAAGFTGRELVGTFARLYGDAVQESSIFAHEGRHAIDQRLDPRMPAAELEYRAKLSEIAFAPRPRLAFDGILSPNIGDRTPHGQANARVMAGLHRWMREHQNEIAGLDLQAPLLPQLPLLTDAQLKRAAAWLDPLARQ